MNHLASKQFQQLQMFATPDEVAQWHAGDFGGKVADVESGMRESTVSAEADGEAYRSFSNGFSYDSHEDYLADLSHSVAERGGIEEPVHVGHQRDSVYRGVTDKFGAVTYVKTAQPSEGQPTLIDGHHRSAVAMRTGRLLPVVHHETVEDARRAAFPWRSW